MTVGAGVDFFVSNGRKFEAVAQESEASELGAGCIMDFTGMSGMTVRGRGQKADG